MIQVIRDEPCLVLFSSLVVLRSRFSPGVNQRRSLFLGGLIAFGIISSGTHMFLRLV